MSDIVIAGYLGFANSGDEALLRVLLEEIKENLPGKTVTVLSMKPKETEAAYGEEYGVRAINRYNIFSVYREFSRSKLLVFGGGSLLQDMTSRRSLAYYLFILRAAIKTGMKTMLLANGVGPLIREKSRRRTAAVLNNVDVITLRDAASAELLKQIGVTGDISVTADSAFLLSDCRVAPSGHDVYDTGMPKGSRYAVISLRSWKNQTASFASVMASLCDDITRKYGIYPLLVPLQYPSDLRIADDIALRAKQPVYIWRQPFTAADIGAVLGGAEFVLAMRLHMLIFAATMGIPVAAISYDPKVEAFMKTLDMPYIVDCGDMADDGTSDKLSQFVSELTSQKATIKEKIKRAADAESARAAENITSLVSLYAK